MSKVSCSESHTEWLVPSQCTKKAAEWVPFHSWHSCKAQIHKVWFVPSWHFVQQETQIRILWAVETVNLLWNLQTDKAKQNAKYNWGFPRSVLVSQKWYCDGVTAFSEVATKSKLNKVQKMVTKMPHVSSSYLKTWASKGRECSACTGRNRRVMWWGFTSAGLFVHQTSQYLNQRHLLKLVEIQVLTCKRKHLFS